MATRRPVTNEDSTSAQSMSKSVVQGDDDAIQRHYINPERKHMSPKKYIRKRGDEFEDHLRDQQTVSLVSPRSSQCLLPAHMIHSSSNISEYR